MKVIALVLISLAVLYAADDTYPRSAVSCAQQAAVANNLWGYGWDGQKCEKCSGDACECFAEPQYNGCDNCHVGYGEITEEIGGVSTKTCEPCHYWTADYTGASIDTSQTVYEANSMSGAINTLSCCFSQQEKTAERDLTCDESNYFFLVGSVCFQINKCATIAHNSYCQTCEAGYYVDTTAENVCTACNTEAVFEENDCRRETGTNAQKYHTLYGKDSCCSSCVVLNQCSSCIDGYYMSTSDDERPGRCVACSDYCTCTGTGDADTQFCSGCIQSFVDTKGYFYNTSTHTCVHCQDNCIVCESHNSCTTCATLFYVNGGVCTACPTGCLECNTDGHCTTCGNGYYLQSNACTRCTTENTNWVRCDVVQGDTPEVVPTQCGVTSSIVGRPTNSAAPHNLSSDYYLVSNTNNEKVCVANNGLNCKMMIANEDPDTQGAMPYKCSSCYEDLDWFLTVDGHCAHCGPYSLDHPHSNHCKNCNQSGQSDLVCIECQQRQQTPNYSGIPAGSSERTNNYYIAQDNTCQACLTGCYTCVGKVNGDSTPDATRKQCTTCQTGYFLNAGTCTQCGSSPGAAQISQCSACTDLTNCTACWAGYRLWTYEDNSGASPVYTYACEACDEGCNECQENRKKCTSCKTGFYLYHGVCQNNRNGCVRSSGDGTCSLCAYGYRAVPGGWCLPCMWHAGGYINCPSCDDNQVTNNANMGESG